MGGICSWLHSQQNTHEIYCLAGDYDGAEVELLADVIVEVAPLWHDVLSDEIIDLNVGGNTKDFTVTKSLFRTFPGTYLDSLVSGNFPL